LNETVRDLPSSAAASDSATGRETRRSGARRGGAVVTHVERKSGYLLAARLPDRTSASVNRATRRLFADLPPSLARTLTLDNGKEFAGHEMR
jgi:IS30 family transposase